MDLTQYQYDGFGRVVAVWAPTEPPPALSTAAVLVAYEGGRGTPFRVQIGRRKDAGGGGYPKRAYEWRIYDGLGRLIQTQQDFDRSHTPIRAKDVNDLSAAVASYNGNHPPIGTVGVGTAPIKATDFLGLRSGIQGLWSGASPTLGTLPSWSSGVGPGGPSNGTSATPIYGSDLVDLRHWLNVYEASKSVGPTGWANDAGQVVIVSRFYDVRNLLVSETVPHLKAENVPGQFDAADWNANPSQNPLTTYTYDALKRPISRKVVLAGPTNTELFQWSYTGWTTTMVDPNNNQVIQVQDALGRLVQVKDLNGAAATEYGYDAVGRLTQVTDAHGNGTTIAYDTIGRKTQLSDPDLGTWSYQYNPIGTLSQQTDSNGHVLSFQYDLIDRLTSKSSSGQTIAAYQYDGPGNGIGRRTSASTGDGQINATFGYDLRGRLTQEDDVINGVSGTQIVTTVYDALDRPLQVTYPDTEVVTMAYGDHGKLVSLQSSRLGALITNVSYNQLLKPTQVSWAPNGTTSFQYYGTELSGSPFGALGTIQSSLETWQYSYDQVGNVTAVNGTGGASYDADNRLASLPWSSESFGYDTIGNLTSLDGLGLGYGSSPTHAPSTVGAVTYQYGGGLLINDGTRTFTSDLENRLATVAQNGANLLSYVYDYDGRRIKRVAGSTTTVYIGERFEINPATGQTRAYYPWGGSPLPMRQNGSLYLLHTDKLGSITNASDGTGASVANQRYKAYGTLLSASGTLPTDRGFTGQIRDGSDPTTNWEFYFYRSRYYNAAIGKFVQPDTIVPDPKNPQALNRYSYALNNPLKLVDPSGHDPKDWFDDTWKQEFRAAHNGADPTAADYGYRLTSMLEATIGQEATRFATDAAGVEWAQTLENSANLGLSYGAGELSAAFRWIGLFRRGGFRIPEYLEFAKAATPLAKAARAGGAVLGGAFLAYDEAKIRERYLHGQISGLQFRDEALTAAGFAAIAVVAGLSLPVEAAVAVGIGAVLATGAVVHAIDQNYDWSPSSLLEGAEGAVLPSTPSSPANGSGDYP